MKTKIAEYVNLIIFRLAYYIGAIVSVLPLFLLSRFESFKYISYFEDRLDYHSYQHFAAGMILFGVARKFLSFASLHAFLFSFFAMFAYEITDGFRVFDKRGFQVSDVGFNLLGAVTAWILN